MLTRDQQYAIAALERVEKIRANKVEEECKKYGAMAHKLPILIHSAGLAQALAFVASRFKKEDIHQQLLTDLAETIGKENKQELLERARCAELREYMRLTQQVLGALLWYKRFAQSILGVDVGDTDVEEAE
jgi:CRISPR-associated protein Cmr5